MRNQEILDKMKKDSKESSVTVDEVNSNEFIGKTGGKP